MTDLSDLFVVEKRPATMDELRGALDRIDSHLANLREAPVNDIEWNLTHALMLLAPIVGSVLNMLDTPKSELPGDVSAKSSDPDDGASATLLAQIFLDGTGKVHTLALCKSGDAYQVRVDGVLMLSYTEPQSNA